MLTMGSLGQATLEYILLLILALFLTNFLVKGVAEESKTRFGNLAHVLSSKLSTGVCESDCFFSGYKNQNVQ